MVLRRALTCAKAARSRSIEGVKHRLAFLGAALIAAALGVVSACSSFDEEPAAVVEAGAAEAGDGGAEAGGRFCANVDASFCADFDLGDIDGGGWDSIEVARGALTLVQSDRSAPSAFQGIIQTGDAGAPDAEVPENAAGATLGKRVARKERTSKTATLDFDVRVDAVSPSKALAFVAGLGFDARSATRASSSRFTLARGSSSPPSRTIPRVSVRPPSCPSRRRPQAPGST